jgi:hypothetical protein
MFKDTLVHSVNHEKEMGDTHCYNRSTNMALFTSFLTFDTSNYNYKHNILLFKDFICAPRIYVNVI